MSRKPLLLGGPAFMPADKHASPARWLLRRDLFDFVGAGLPANVGMKTLPLTGTHRQQAGFYSSSLSQLRAFNSMMRAARSKVTRVSSRRVRASSWLGRTSSAMPARKLSRRRPGPEEVVWGADKTSGQRTAWLCRAGLRSGKWSAPRPAPRVGAGSARGECQGSTAVIHPPPHGEAGGTQQAPRQSSSQQRRRKANLRPADVAHGCKKLNVWFFSR